MGSCGLLGRGALGCRLWVRGPITAAFSFNYYYFYCFSLNSVWFIFNSSSHSNYRGPWGFHKTNVVVEIYWIKFVETMNVLYFNLWFTYKEEDHPCLCLTYNAIRWHNINNTTWLADWASQVSSGFNCRIIIRDLIHTNLDSDEALWTISRGGTISKCVFVYMFTYTWRSVSMPGWEADCFLNIFQHMSTYYEHLNEEFSVRQPSHCC